MTVEQSDIALYSSHAVSEDGPFTVEMFEGYSVTAQAILDKINPGFDAETYDWAHALLIIHLYELKQGTIEMKSVSPGEWEFVQPGITSWWLQVMNAVKVWKQNTVKTAKTLRGVVIRADAVNAFKMDKEPVFDPYKTAADIEEYDL